MESKHEKFLRLAAKRVDKAVYHLELIANLASHNYEYSETDAEEIVSQLQASLDQIKEAFDLVAQDDLEIEIPPPSQDVPKEVVERNTGPFIRGWAQWAYETLRRGEKKEAEGMLLRALQGDGY